MVAGLVLQLRRIAALSALLAAALVPAGMAAAQSEGPDDVAQNIPPYATLVDLARASDIVARVVIDDQVAVSPERSPGLAAGEVRLYIEAETEALLAGSSPVGSALTFLVDLPLAENGRAPRIEKQTYLLFADLVPSRPGTIQLVGENAMQPATPELEAAVRGVLTQLVEADAVPTVTGIREVISVAGNLAGESETQIFVETASGAPVSLSVVRRPAMAPQWGVSWSEIVDASARPPAADTIEWYALACFLPRELPDDSFLQPDAASQTRAREDYAVVLESLGACR